jgi:hypothetical protein
MDAAGSILAPYGLAGLCITALALTLRTVYAELKAERARSDAIQLARLQDAKETRDKLTESTEQQAFLVKQIYELLQQLISDSRRRR